MSEERVEIVRRALEAFNESGPEALFDDGLAAPDLVLDLSPMKIPGIGVYRGRDEIVEFFLNEWFASFPFDSWEHETKEIIDCGDKVVAVVVQRGRGKSSEAPVELETAQLATLRDGQIVHNEIYLDRQKALEAAGLSE